MISKLLTVLRDSSGTFEGQEQDEKIVILTRHHPFGVLVRITLAGVAAVVPILAGTILWPALSAGGSTALFIFLSSVWYMILWVGTFYALTMYTLDTMIVTNHRVIDHDQYGFFNRHVAELHISRIQDISVHTQGYIPTVFNFGDVIIQTAGQEKRFTFPRIPHPERVKNAIMKLMHELHNHRDM